MSLDIKRKVPLPESGIVRNKSGKSIYIYYITRIYRNKKGQPTNDRIAIGRLDEESNMLIPNKTYYEIFSKDDRNEQIKIETIKSCGLTYVVDGILKELNLIKVMKMKFPCLSDKIIALAEYMLCEGNIMSHYDEWYNEVYPYDNVSLSSSDISRVFQAIDYESRMDFFKTWIYAKEQDEYISYDVTSISSYATEIDSLEWGYNRDKESLPQINFAMYYGQQSRLPLYYSIYPGSIPDKTHLSYMLRDNEILGCKKIRYVLDRGFFSYDNLQFMVSAGTRFIIAVPNSINFTKELIDKYRNKIVNRSECRLGKDLPYAKEVIREDYGFRLKVHIYYNPAKASAEAENLFDEIEKCERALSEMDEPPVRSLKYDRYFKINRKKHGGFGFIRDNEKIDTIISRLGFFVIAETIFTATSLEILESYKQRDVIEKSFGNLKNELDMKRLHCHSNETVEGKMFVAFFALILRSCMFNKLKQYMSDNNLSFKSALRELNKLKYVRTADGRKLLTPITKKQRDLLNKCALSEDDLLLWLDSISV